MKKTVTVAVPVYNGEKYLPIAMQSIIDQTYNVDHILICDNRSTDNTVSIIKQFIANYPEKSIQLYQNETNIGATNNFNKCFELCETDLLLILGTDDRLKPNSIELHLKLFNDMPELAIVGGRFDFINQNGEVFRKAVKGEKLVFQKMQLVEFMEKTNFYLQFSTVMYNMKFTREVGFYDTDFIGPDERQYVKHLIKYPIALIGEAVAEARYHDDQETKDEHKRFKDKILHYKANLKMAEFESSPERIKKLRTLIKKWITDQCIYNWKSMWHKQNMKKLALRYWIYGFKINPYYFIRIYMHKARRAIQKITGFDSSKSKMYI